MLDKLQNLTNKQKSYLLLGLGLVLILAFVVSSILAKDKQDQVQSPEEPQAAEEVPQEETGTITKFSIASDRDSLAPGEELQFTAFIEGEGAYDDTVTWSIQGTHHEKTTISPDGKLSLALEETADQIIVRGVCGGGAYVSDKPITILQQASLSPSSTPSPAAVPASPAPGPSSPVSPTAPSPSPQKDTPSTKAPSSQEKPAPVEKTPPKASQVKLSISVKTILNNKDKLAPEKAQFIPENGYILEPTDLEVQEGQTVFDLLKKVTQEKKIPLESSTFGGPRTAYVQGLNNIYSQDLGPMSGWLYKVNGDIPSVGMAEYVLKDKDQVEIVYSVDGGKDISK